MLAFRRLAVLLYLLVVQLSAVQAQSTANTLSQRLLKNVFLLRPPCFDIPLRFDAKGELGSICNPVPFTVGLVQIDRIDLKADSLDLRAHRVGLTFKNGQPHPFDLARVLPIGVNSKVEIHIASPISGDYQPALDHIFASSFSQMYADVPDYWRAYFLDNLLPKDQKPGGLVASAPVETAGQNGTTIPRVVHQVDAQYTEYAKLAQFTGSVAVSLVVDTEGKPVQLEVYTPAGLGLDEEAIKAVSQYRFKPATRNRVPVPTKMRVEVSFQLLR